MGEYAARELLQAGEEGGGDAGGGAWAEEGDGDGEPERLQPADGPAQRCAACLPACLFACGEPQAAAVAVMLPLL